MSEIENISTIEATPHETGVPIRGESRPHATRLLAWLLVVWLLLVGAGLWRWVIGAEYRKQKRALIAMRSHVELALAPGEKVVVDDRLLAWALRGNKHGEFHDSVWTVREDEPVASLLQRMATQKSRELVVVARPDDRLIRNLDAAGFSVAQEVGWVPWDVKGDGLSLLGRGRMRVYFVVAPPLPTDATHSARHKGGDVSSKESGVQR